MSEDINEGLSEEYIQEKSRAKVSVYTSLLSESSTSSRKSKNIDGYTWAAVLRHWILVFEFDNEDIRCIEGVNEDGVLKPIFSKSKDPSWDFEEFKGYVIISPKEIRDLAIGNRYNGRSYSITCSRTCHDWLIDILNNLETSKKLEIYEQPKTVTKTFWSTAAAVIEITARLIFAFAQR